MLQLILHLFGDYISQSHWMATNKSKASWPCFWHCLLYTLPFLLVTSNIKALGIIFSTHFLIDRFGLARYLVWLKNWISPDVYAPWSVCKNTGYIDRELIPDPDFSDTEAVQAHAKLCAESRPVWLRVWLLIVADNTLHLACNALALFYFPG